MRLKETALILPVLVALLAFFFLRQHENPASSESTLPSPHPLERFQNTISRETFLTLLESVYTKGSGWSRWIEIAEDHAEITFLNGTFILQFADTDQPPPGAIWNWNLSTANSPEAPLAGLHIALDPGHIGGAFAEMEERSLVYGPHPPIQEGSMTLATARILQPMLEKLGAQVSLVRSEEQPVTTATPDDFSVKRLFYRTSEIHARAERVNHEFQPDLVLCLHYNASGSPVPLPGQHFHILLNGTYHASELEYEEERLSMLQRLLSRVHKAELPLAESMAGSFALATGLPPYHYRDDHPFSQNLAGNPYLWARNLLANRLYLCPVIFLEPYVMNSTEFIARFEQSPEEIYYEYAHAVTQGLLRHFSPS